MHKADEYRRRAREALERAEQADSDVSPHFLEVAAAYRVLAAFRRRPAARDGMPQENTQRSADSKHGDEDTGDE